MVLGLVWAGVGCGSESAESAETPATAEAPSGEATEPASEREAPAAAADEAPAAPSAEEQAAGDESPANPEAAGGEGANPAAESESAPISLEAEFGPAFSAILDETPACEGSGGDEAAVRAQLRTMSRRPEVEPPALDELIAGCAVSRRDAATAYNRGGLRHHRRRNYEASRAWFLAAIQADPSLLSVRYNYACALGRLGQAAEAGALLELIYTGRPEGERWWQRSLVDPDLSQARRLIDFWDPFHMSRLPEVLSRFPSEPGLDITLVWGPPGTLGHEVDRGDDDLDSVYYHESVHRAPFSEDAMGAPPSVEDGLIMAPVRLPSLFFREFARRSERYSARASRENFVRPEWGLRPLNGFMRWFPDVGRLEPFIIVVMDTEGHNDEVNGGPFLGIIDSATRRFVYHTTSLTFDTHNVTDVTFVRTPNGRAFGWVAFEDDEQMRGSVVLFYMRNVDESLQLVRHRADLSALEPEPNPDEDDEPESEAAAAPPPAASEPPSSESPTAPAAE